MLFKEWTRINFLQQRLWGFPEDSNYHPSHRLPHCICPKMDGDERLGTPYHVVTQGCLIHDPVRPMKTKDLIKQLQKLVDEHESYIEVMGEHEIVIDVFEEIDKDKHTFRYAGFDPRVTIDYSSDGVYPILSAFANKDQP